MPSRPRRKLTDDADGQAIATVTSRRQGGHVTEMQRLRLLTATFDLVGGGGVPAVTVASVSQRAGVSRRTFYELFGDREACLAAAFDHAISRAMETVSTAFDRESGWRAAMRAGLIALLGFLDGNPSLARLLVVEAVAVGPVVVRRRVQICDRLIAVVDRGRAEAAVDEAQPLTAEAVVGAVLSVIQSRLLERGNNGSGPPVLELTGQLMGVIVHPYLGVAAAQAEIEAPTPTQSPREPDPELSVTAEEPFKDLPMRLTYRTALVLSSIAETPGASSKQVARAAGVSDEGQMSRLLARLERYGLVENRGGQPSRGEAKAWILTGRGQGVVRAVGAT